MLRILVVLLCSFVLMLALEVQGEVDSEVPIEFTGQFQVLSEYSNDIVEMRLGKTEIGIKAELTKTLGLRMIYKVYSDFKVALFDAYASWKPIQPIEIQFGQFKTRFSLENRMAPYKRDFIEEAVANKLVSTRDFGVGLILSTGMYEGGFAVINGEGLNKQDANCKKDIVGYISAMPYKSLLIGTAAYLGYSGPDSSLGEIERYNVHLHYRKPFHYIFQTEFTYDRTPEIITKAYYLTIGYNLKEFLPHGLILEPLVRFQYIDNSTNLKSEQYLTLGVNYYIEENYKVRIQANYQDRLSAEEDNNDSFILGIYYAFN